MRTIFHIDVNSAFLSWEAARRLSHGDTVDLREIPAVIGGDEAARRGIVLAKSIPAKEHGIVTGEPLGSARRKCPNLTIAPADHALYGKESKKLFTLLRRFSPVLEQFSIDECFLDYTGMEGLFGEPIAAAHHIKDTVYQETGVTVNIGISENKLLAKMASDFQKPNRVHTLFPSEIPEKMWPLPVSDLFLVGRRLAPRLHQLGIHTIGDLAHADPELLTFHFHSMGKKLWSYANGMDTTDFAEPQPPKSIGNSVTLPENILTESDAASPLMQLSESVAARLRKHHFSASLISITLRTADFVNYSHQQKVEIPTNQTAQIYQIASRLFHETWNGEPLRHIGIQASSFVPSDLPQASLFDTPKRKKGSDLDVAIDKIRARYGSPTIKRGIAMEQPLPVNHQPFKTE